MRTTIPAVIFALVLAAFGSPLAAQTNPVPFLNNPTVPAAIAPGGQGFTLKVNGAGFVSGATVKWNGSARTTTFLSSTELTAAILASDIVTAATVLITVSNPPSGGGVSNTVLFEVTTPTTSLAFTRTDTAFEIGGVSAILQPAGMVAGYSPVGASPTLSVANGKCPSVANCSVQLATVSTLSNAGVSEAYLGESPGSIVTGDFNGDGVLDLITLGSTGISVSIGNADGSFQFSKSYPLPAGAVSYPAPVVGDFNRDGHLDLVLAGASTVYFLPGNGNGAFGSAVSFSTGGSSGSLNAGLVAGDFNGDGILDLAVTDELGNFVSILLGNGDGTFKTPVEYPTGSLPGAIVAGDFNGDGKLDLAVIDGSGTTVSILLGNGDGTFQAKVDYPAGVSLFSLTLGDFNGDGILDIAASDTRCTNSGCPTSGSVNLLLGNGNGTFQSQLDFAAGAEPEYIVSGDFLPSSPPSGRSGFAAANYQDNTVSVYSALQSQTGTTNPLPTISSISPTFVIEGSGSFLLTVNGTNFVSGSTISFGGQTEPTAVVSSTQLTASIPGSAISTAGRVTVLVFTPAPGGGNSATAGFNVLLPAPTISSIVPSSAIVNSPGFTLTINGTNFVNGSTANFNGISRPAVFVSSTQITASVLSSDLVNQGTTNISVTNPIGTNNSGGGTSSTVPLTVLPTSSQPTIGALSPASTTAGGLSFTLKITGTGFGATSVVTFGSNTVSSAYVSPSELQAAIPASAIAVAGTPLVTVANPGGNPSLVTSFTVNNPVPAAASLSPTSIPAGNPSLTVNVTGANFVQGSIVQVNGASRTTTFVNATSLTATLPASDFVHSGTLNISVNNPAPGGGITGALALIVADFNLSVPSPSQTVSAGQKASYNLMLAAINGTLGGAVTFSASGPPAGAGASFMPASVPAGNAGTTVVLSITTTPHSSGSLWKFPHREWPHGPLYGLALAIGMLCLAHWTLRERTRRLAPIFLIVLLLAIAGGLAACGSSGGSSGTQINPGTGTPAGTYTITVNATSGGATITTTVMLTVM